MKLGARELTRQSTPYIIAEIGVNHEGSLDTARRLIDLCKEGGADAAKFQTYKAETLASRDSPSYWDRTKEPTANQFQLFKKYDSFGPAEYQRLAEHCADVGIDFVSTPFDLGAVDLLAPLVPFFKIASADVTNVPLLRKVAAAGRPIVLSTGASTTAEVDDALGVLAAAGNPDAALMHCVLNYPTPRDAANLGMVRGLARQYPDRIIGYSDHTVPDEGMSSLVTAYLLGAVILEKHFTHDRSLPGNDHYHAMDVDDLKRLKARLADLEALLGSASGKSCVPSEEPARRHARRSVVTSRAMQAGETLGPDDLLCKRPASGISPIHWDALMGRRVLRDLEEDAILTWNDVDGARPDLG